MWVLGAQITLEMYDKEELVYVQPQSLQATFCNSCSLL